MVKGEVYFAAIPYLPHTPLRYFMEEKDEQGKGTGVGRVMEAGTAPLIGDNKNPTMQVVLPVKARMTIIISPIGRLRGNPTAIVVPIESIKPEHIQKSKFKKRLCEGEEFREALYLPPRPGLPEPSYAAIVDVKLVHETLFTARADWRPTAEEIRKIDLRLAECFTSSVVLACQTCNRDCGACELLAAVNRLRT